MINELEWSLFYRYIKQLADVLDAIYLEPDQVGRPLAPKQAIRMIAEAEMIINKLNLLSKAVAYKRGRGFPVPYIVKTQGSC